jgi:hypothetical protein
MFLLDGKRLQPGTAFTHGGIQYPANWLNHASQQEKQAIGITEVTEQSRPDDRFYWVTDNNNGTFSTIDKQLNDDTANNSTGLKTQWINQFKSTTNSILSSTDWMVIRKAERNIDIPESVSTYRAAIITEMNRLETAISSANTIAQLITTVQSQNWPQE